MLSILSLQSAAYVAKVAVPSPLLRARRSVMMLDPPTGVQHLSSLLAEGAETIGPVLIAQMGVSGGMCAGGPRHCSDAGRHTHAAPPGNGLAPSCPHSLQGSLPSRLAAKPAGP